MPKHSEIQFKSAYSSNFLHYAHSKPRALLRSSTLPPRDGYSAVIAASCTTYSSLAPEAFIHRLLFFASAPRSFSLGRFLLCSPDSFLLPASLYTRPADLPSTGRIASRLRLTGRERGFRRDANPQPSAATPNINHNVGTLREGEFDISGLFLPRLEESWP